MKRLSLSRRRKRNRVLRALEQAVHRVIAAIWLIRTLVRHRLAAR
jgi:hypothetical protein